MLIETVKNGIMIKKISSHPVPQDAMIIAKWIER
jgi:hypothetical protein